MFRIGQGFDIHPLKKGRKLVLGGVRIPFSYGLDGHSDADCLFHAITDAILGALGEGDIGEHFPPTDPKYKDQNSDFFVRYAVKAMTKNGYRLENIDTTVYAEAPHLGGYKKSIGKNIARLLKVPENRVNIKAKTMEKFGSIGKGEAIAAEAVVLLKKSSQYKRE